MMRRLAMLGAVLLAVSVAGCSRSPRVVFYTLSPVAPVQQKGVRGAEPAVVVGPVTVPESVDRPQLVVRDGGDRVQILEMHRWVESLKSELPQVIAQNLRRLLGSNRISSYRQNAGATPDYRVLVDIIRFEAVPGEGVTVEADWSVRPGSTGGAATNGHSLLREKAPEEGYDSQVAAFNRALARLSADLAKTIRAQAASPRKQ